MQGKETLSKFHKDSDTTDDNVELRSLQPLSCRMYTQELKKNFFEISFDFLKNVLFGPQVINHV
jgi:hypothetical protein